MQRTVVMMAVAATLAAGRGEELVRTAFSAAAAPAAKALAATRNPRATGALPPGWEDDSAWAQAWVDYGFGDEQGTRFLRMAVSRIDDGRAQLIVFPLPDAPGDRLYRLALTCRHQTGAAVTFGLRQRGTPYHFYWERTARFSANWETQRYEFRLGKNEQSMGLWFNLATPGAFDIAAVVLERFSDEELVGEVRARHPDGGPANLFRQTRFPLGLPNGWALDRDVSDGDVASATAAAGPDHPALRLCSPELVRLRSEPFAVVYPVVPHQAALSLQGHGEWEVAVTLNGAVVGATKVTATATWQRVRVPFAPKLGVPFYQVRISGTGAVLLDQFQAGPADKGAEYVAPAACEVALGVPSNYAAAAARVVFADEGPVRLDGWATGTLAEAVLQSRLTSVYGQTVELPPLPLPADGRFSVDVGPGLAAAPLGSFRLEAWAERAGKPVSPVSELVFHRLERPRYWGQDAPNSPFGVHTNSTTRHLLMAKAIGLNWTRLHDAGLQYVGWWMLEPRRGEWTFFDRELQRYRTHHIRILAELGTAPAWASYYADTGRTEFGYFDKFFQPKDLNDYATYVRTVCARYRGQIDAFDVWNEPWIHAWWGVAYDAQKGGRAGYVTSREPQRDFARLMKVARDTARSVLPEATVAGFNTTTGSASGDGHFSGSDWTRGVLEAGGLADCDSLAYHAYTGDGVGFPGDSVEKGLAVALGPIREALGSVPKPVWMTEGSPLIHRVGNGLYRHTVQGEAPDDLLDDADRLARYLVSLLANQVQRIFLYSMHAHGDFGTDPKAWNVFTTDEGSLHPSGAAHAHCAWLLEDLAFRERLEVAPGLHAYLFAGTERAVAAVSSSPVWQPWALPAAVPGVVWTDLFGNPVPGGTPFAGRLLYASAAGAGGVETLKVLFGSPR